MSSRNCFESVHVLLEFLASRIDIYGFPAGIFPRSQGEVQEQNSEIYTSALYHFGFGYGSRGLFGKNLYGERYVVIVVVILFWLLFKTKNR